MAIHAQIIGATPTTLWGLSSHERLRRLFARARVTGFVDEAAALPIEGTVVLIRGDYLYDDRVIAALVRAPDVLLDVQAGPARLVVAAHVPASLAPRARKIMDGNVAPGVLPGVRLEAAETLAPAYQRQLRKLSPPFVRRITSAERRELEALLFSGAYKGVTDLVTKWVWPRPAEWATRICASIGARPNHVTSMGLVLVVVAGVLFAHGQYAWGLIAGWLMTFLDTVDGKLARVTVTSSRFGNVLDHGIDLVHPPLWYLAWGLGLGGFEPGLPGLSLSAALWLTVAGYVAGRLIEGAFHLWIGPFSIFSWRPVDSYFRLITARRNPNLILLTVGAALGRPDLGLVAVTGWTVVSSLILAARFAMAWRSRVADGPLRSWLGEVSSGPGKLSLAERLFAARPARQSSGRFGSP